MHLVCAASLCLVLALTATPAEGTDVRSTNAIEQAAADPPLPLPAPLATSSPSSAVAAIINSLEQCVAAKAFDDIHMLSCVKYVLMIRLVVKDVSALSAAVQACNESGAVYSSPSCALSLANASKSLIQDFTKVVDSACKDGCWNKLSALVGKCIMGDDTGVIVEKAMNQVCTKTAAGKYCGIVFVDTANDFRQNLEQCDVNQLAQEKVCPPLCKAHFETVFSDLGCCYPEIADLLYETVAPVDVIHNISETLMGCGVNETRRLCNGSIPKNLNYPAPITPWPASDSTAASTTTAKLTAGPAAGSTTTTTTKPATSPTAAATTTKPATSPTAGSTTTTKPATSPTSAAKPANSAASTTVSSPAVKGAGSSSSGSSKHTKSDETKRNIGIGIGLALLVGALAGAAIAVYRRRNRRPAQRYDLSLSEFGDGDDEHLFNDFL